MQYSSLRRGRCEPSRARMTNDDVTLYVRVHLIYTVYQNVQNARDHRLSKRAERHKACPAHVPDVRRQIQIIAILRIQILRGRWINISTKTGGVSLTHFRTQRVGAYTVYAT